MSDDGYRPIGDYAFVGDCISAALISRDGSVDWCCLPRIDHGSCFGRLLDARRGGHCAISAAGDDVHVTRGYVDGSLVLETRYSGPAGDARLIDCMPVDPSHPERPYGQLVRILEGTRGRAEFRLRIVARFDYGAVRPWRRLQGPNRYTLTGGDDALVVTCDADLERLGDHDLEATIVVRPGERCRVTLTYTPPHRIDAPEILDPGDVDARVEATIDWWRGWSGRARLDGPDGPGAVRSAIVLKGLSNTVTGAIAAAVTTSLPERAGGAMNWDYRYSWIRDSTFGARSLAEIGLLDEANAFRRFIERSAAGSAEEMQIMYGVGGERRLVESELPDLEGYRGARPVRIGNAAARQFQLDAYGELVELSWRWHQRGAPPDDDYWRFLLDLVDSAAQRWREPDQGLWELRGEPRHHVHSKAMCWVALDRGIRMAEESLRQAPLGRWRRERDAVREAIESEGYDAERGVFVQAFGSRALDAALLLLPSVGFVAWDDERMVRTVDAIREELGRDGLLLRYARDDGDEEGAFLACGFWLAECLARQGRLDEARGIYDRCVSTGNDLGLFAEEYDPERGEMLGNFPQGLTHLSHIAAAVALAESAERMRA